MAADAQEAIFAFLGQRAFITPGVGVDPTNEYRDRQTKYQQLAGQSLGHQDLADRNLIKVSLDYCAWHGAHTPRPHRRPRPCPHLRSHPRPHSTPRRPHPIRKPAAPPPLRRPQTRRSSLMRCLW